MRSHSFKKIMLKLKNTVKIVYTERKILFVLNTFF